MPQTPGTPARQPTAGSPLRRRLFVLTAAGILPLAVMSALGLYALQAQQRVQAERVGLELARSVANAVQTELQGTSLVLETLATTPTLDANDLDGFRARAVRVLAARPDWAGIVLDDPAGRRLVDTRASSDRPSSVMVDADSFETVVRSGAPAVGSLIRDDEGTWLVPVRVPVVRDRAVKFVVTALLTPESVRSVLVRQRLPDDWIISIVDSHGRRVARSRAHDENLGGPLAESARQIVAQGGTEGFGISYTLEGERIFTPYARLPSSGWIAALGFPTALADAAAFRALSTYGGGVLLSIALGGLAAMWVAGTITRPIAELRAAAVAVGRRQTPQVPHTSIVEIRDVSTALAEAAADLKAFSAQRDELLRSEQLARTAAETADRAKDEFMAVLSHELRTPLNAVYGWAKMLQSGQLRDDDAAARAKDAIVRNADAQMQLIDDLLDMSRIVSGKLRLDLQTVALDQVLHAAVDAVRPAAEAKSIRIETSIEPGINAVNGDAGRLQQVVWNLLMNAVKFTPAAGDVRMRLQRTPSHIRVVVADSGEGIDPAVLPHVFERFRQGDSSSTRPHGGLGLGLALVRHLVEAHGGTVVAESPGDGKGSTFTVTLPKARFPAYDATEVAGPLNGHTSGMPPHAVRLDGIRVLVVDDDRDGLMLATAILTAAGAAVRACGSAADAFALLREWRPDVLVSDIEMPGEDGYSLIGRVRSLDAAAGGATAAIALTAYGRAQDRERATAAGFNMHVPKPVDPGELTAIVAAVTVGSPGPLDRTA